MNQVCDHALILSALGECRSVTGSAIEEAWGDLQQLPTPWQTGSTRRDTTPAVVEFAPLDEMPDDSAAIPFPTPRTPYPPQAPDEQLEQIEQQLAELDEDFQPAGSIGPEIELVFNENSDPFGEAFDEEEVVIDRYASLEADLFAERPAVNSREGQELSHLLTPWMNRAAEPTLSMTSSGRTNPQEPEKQESLSNPAAVDRRNVSQWECASTATAVAVQTEGIAPLVASTSSEENRVNWIHHAYTQAATTGGIAAADSIMPGVQSMGAPATDDADLIVVEDDVATSGHISAPPPLVRRQEYRQLFSRMRADSALAARVNP